MASTALDPQWTSLCWYVRSTIDSLRLRRLCCNEILSGYSLSCAARPCCSVRTCLCMGGDFCRCPQRTRCKWRLFAAWRVPTIRLAIHAGAFRIALGQDRRAAAMSMFTLASSASSFEKLPRLELHLMHDRSGLAANNSFIIPEAPSSPTISTPVISCCIVVACWCIPLSSLRRVPRVALCIFAFN